MKRKNWTPADDHKLIELHPNHTINELVKAIGRTKYSVKSRIETLRRAGVPLEKTAEYYRRVQKANSHKQALSWTPAEDALLKDMFPTSTYNQIAERLNRTWQAVENRVTLLRAKGHDLPKRWVSRNGAPRVRRKRKPKPKLHRLELPKIQDPRPPVINVDRPLPVGPACRCGNSANPYTGLCSACYVNRKGRAA